MHDLKKSELVHFVQLLLREVLNEALSEKRRQGILYFKTRKVRETKNG